MNRITYPEQLTKYCHEKFRNAEYFECANFNFKYDTARRAYLYANGGSPAFGEMLFPSSLEWDEVLQFMAKAVPLSDRPRIKTQVYKYQIQRDWLSGGGDAGFVFSIDNKFLCSISCESFIS